MTRYKLLNLVQCPNGVVEIHCKTYPKNVGRQKPRARFRDFIKSHDRNENGDPEEHDLNERTTGTMSTEKDNRPERVEY